MSEKQNIITVKKLILNHVTGSGFQVKAFIESEKGVDCVEYVMKTNADQPVMMQAPPAMWATVGCDMWVQFKPKTWEDMEEKLFKEMVEAWNEKYAKE